jgi:hypothetical protein
MTDNKVESGSPATMSDDLAAAYGFLQMVVGVIAFGLPVVVVVGEWLLGTRGPWEVRASLSQYYFGDLRDVFVGSLFIFGFFFLSYHHRRRPGYELDFYLTNTAAVASFLVALFPTPADGADLDWRGVVHLSAAGVVLAVMAFLVLHAFTKTHHFADESPSAALRRLFRDPLEEAASLSIGRRRRNRLYRTVGWSMVGLLVATALRGVTPLLDWLPLPASWFLWVEALFLWLFGTAWLVKSSAMNRLLRLG